MLHGLNVSGVVGQRYSVCEEDRNECPLTGESAENQYGLGKLHYVLPSQSTDYVGLTSQVQVQQENHDPTLLIKPRSAEEFHKGILQKF